MHYQLPHILLVSFVDQIKDRAGACSAMQNESSDGIEIRLANRGSVGAAAASSSGLKQVLNILLMMPGVFASLMAMGTYTPMNSRPLMGIILGVFLLPFALQILSMVLRLSNGNSGIWRFFYTVSSVVLVLFAVLLFANGGLDQSKPTEVHATILGKSVIHGRRVTRYHLTVTSWRQSGSNEGLDVSEKTFDRVVVGGSVSLELHLGRFGIPWRGEVSPD